MSSKTLPTDLTAPSPARPRRGATLLGVYVAVGLLAIGFNLRIGVSGVGLLLPEIERGLGVPPSVAGLLNTIPVVAFGAFAFLTPPLVRRVGLSRLLWLTMAVAAIGIGMRVIASPVALFGGTVLLGAALAVANVCMPMAIKRDFPQREDLMMGLYTVALSLGAALVAALMVPLMSAFGGSWRHALGFWALPAVIASFAAAAVYRVHPTWMPVTISTALQVGGFAGLLVAPSGGWAWWWMTLLGLGQGSAITLALGYIVLRSPDPRHAGILSTMAQGIGYLVAALGPLAVGVLYTTTRGWGIPIGLLIVLLVAQFAAGAAASQDRLILGRRPAPEGTAW